MQVATPKGSKRVIASASLKRFDEGGRVDFLTGVCFESESATE